MTTSADDQLKAILSEEEYEDLMKIRVRKSTRAQKGQVQELTRNMVGEGGKYETAYSEATDVLDAIWDKAFAEATFEITGINPDDEVEEEGEEADDDEDQD